MSDYTEARRLDRCDVCGRKVKRDDLRIMTQQYARSKGSNYFIWSQYHTDLWTCDGTDRSTISDGVRADECRVKVSLANVSTESGVQTWSGTGTFRVKDGAGIDVSAWTSLTFACVVGSWQGNGCSTTYPDPPNLTVDMGIWDLVGGTGTSYKSYTGITASRECWFTANIADLSAFTTSALAFYVLVTPSASEYYWVDELRLEKDVTVPTQWIRTTGAAVNRTVMTKYLGSGKVCSECRYPLFKTDAGAPEIEPSEPINIDIESTIL